MLNVAVVWWLLIVWSEWASNSKACQHCVESGCCCEVHKVAVINHRNNLNYMMHSEFVILIYSRIVFHIFCRSQVVYTAMMSFILRTSGKCLRCLFGFALKAETWIWCCLHLDLTTLSSFMLSYPVLCYPIQSYPILSYPILSYPTLSYPILSNPILSYPILSYSHLAVSMNLVHNQNWTTPKGLVQTCRSRCWTLMEHVLWLWLSAHGPTDSEWCQRQMMWCMTLLLFNRLYSFRLSTEVGGATG